MIIRMRRWFGAICVGTTRSRLYWWGTYTPKTRCIWQRKRRGSTDSKVYFEQSQKRPGAYLSMWQSGIGDFCFYVVLQFSRKLCNGLVKLSASSRKRMWPYACFSVG